MFGMIKENLSTLEIHQMTRAQYNREEEAGNLDKHAIYITPDEEINLTPYATIDYVDSQDYNNLVLVQDLQSQMNNALAGKSNTTHTHDGRYYTESEIDSKLSGKANTSHNHAASEITSGTLSSDRLPTVPIAKGGTGATTAAKALTNLGITATASELNKLDGCTATVTELNYVDGVTSNIQTQLNGKAASSHTHWYLSPINGGSNTAMMTSGGNFYPYANEGQQLGTTASRWSWVMCKSVDESSDERKKEDFSTDMDKYVTMLDLLEPTSYHFKGEVDDEDRRRNVGYIAQRVQEAMTKAGLENKDFGGLHYDEEGESKGEYTYGLAYSQFIPILHAKIKQLEEKYNAKIEEYDAKIAELNEKLAALTV